MEAEDEKSEILIPADSVAILDLLLRSALCASHMWDEALASLPDVERDETLDAISQGALPLPQLTWEWGATVGEIDTLKQGGQDIDLTDFYASFESLAEAFAIQISVPIIGDVHDSVEMMPPFRGQRLQLVNRSDWLNFGPVPEDLQHLQDFDEAEIADKLPIFTDPAIQIGERRVGEVWVRLHPEVICRLKETPEELFNLLIWLADTRVRQLRETVRQRQSTLADADLSILAIQLQRVTSWQRLLRHAQESLEQVPVAKRIEKLPGVLEIATGHWEDYRKPGDQVEPLKVFVSYARESTAHNAWVRRVADKLEAFREFHVVFDGYDLHAGKDLTHFMDQSLAADRVVVIITPEYVRKATDRIGGVGYESSVISADLLEEQLADRYIPVLRAGVQRPAFLRSTVYVDFREDCMFDEALCELRSALLRLAPVERPSKTK